MGNYKSTDGLLNAWVIIKKHPCCYCGHLKNAKVRPIKELKFKVNLIAEISDAGCVFIVGWSREQCVPKTQIRIFGGKLEI